MRKIPFGLLSAKLVVAALFLFTSCQKSWNVSRADTVSALVLDTTVTSNPEMEKTIEPYRQQVEKQMHEVIGFALEELDRGPVESPLGNFITELLLNRTGIAYGKKVDLALTTNGGLRTPIPQGNVKVGDIYELMPFENEVVVLTLKGETVVKLFEYAAKKENAPIAGATFTIDKGQATEIKINGKPLSTSATYTVATSDYLANGGDNMPFLKDAIKYEQLGITFRDTILNHIKALTAAGKKIEPPLRNRVTIR